MGTTASTPADQQQQPVSNTPNNESLATNKNANRDTDPTTVSFHKESNSSTSKKQLTGMALVKHQCRKKEKAYRSCVSEWYTKEFMTSKSLYQAEACGDKFEVYRACVLKGVKREIWDKQGLPPPEEGSLLAELEEEKTK
jgi:hypothetical protein